MYQSKALLPSQRQMRHIRGVYVRNIDLHELTDTFFRVLVIAPSCDQEKQRSNAQCLYESALCEQSLNPMWIFDELEFVTSHTKNAMLAIAGKNAATVTCAESADDSHLIEFDRCREMMVELMYLDRLSGESRLICRTRFDFRDVVFIGDSIDALVYDTLPLNCIIMEFVDGMFLAEETFTLMGKPINVEHDVITRFACLQPTDMPPVEIGLPTVEKSIADLLNARNLIKESEERAQAHRTEINEILKRHSVAVGLKQGIENARARIKRLQKKIELKKQQIGGAEESLAEKHDALQRDQGIFEFAQQQLFEERKKLLHRQREELPQQRAQLSVLNAKCASRRNTIVRQIQDMFPIVFHPKGEYYTINNLSILKGDQLGSDDETAAALGYVAHCVTMLSKLFQVVLKFPVYPLASRSFVREDIADQKILLPLFLPKASERPKYHRAIMLLNFNIFHFLQVRGSKMTTKNKPDVLGNLMILFKTLCSS